MRWLGKKGTLTEQLKSLGALPAAERPAAGARINEAKERRAGRDRGAARARWRARTIERELAAGRIDVTLPGRGEERGGLHPVTLARAAHRDAVPPRRFRCRRGSGDRGRLPQLRGAQHSRRITRRGRCTTPSTSRTGGCCARTPRRCRSARCWTHGAPIAIIAPGRVYRLRLRHDALADVPPARGAGGGRERQLRQHEGGAARLSAGVLRARSRDAAAAFVLPVHGAVRRSRHVVRVLRRQGLPHLQAHRLARDLRLRHGAPERAQGERRRRGALHRLRLRRRHRSAGDAALRRERPAAVLRERPALPASSSGRSDA